jgi:hypothetical protein
MRHYPEIGRLIHGSNFRDAALLRLDRLSRHPARVISIQHRRNGVAIIEAPSIYHARLQAAVRGIGRAADYSEGNEVDAEHAALIPQD